MIVLSLETTMEISQTKWNLNQQHCLLWSVFYCSVTRAAQLSEHKYKSVRQMQRLGNLTVNVIPVRNEATGHTASYVLIDVVLFAPLGT